MECIKKKTIEEIIEGDGYEILCIPFGKVIKDYR